MARINFKRLKQQVAQQAGPRITTVVDRVLDRKYERSRKIFLDSIRNHPISQELEAGPEAENNSKTLGNVKNGGNLFSFFGFPEGSVPIELLMDYLEDKENVKRNPTKRTRGKKEITYSSSVDLPDIRTLESLTSKGEPAHITDKYSNQGWIYGVRRQHPGYPRYIYDVVERFKKSRSGTAVQLEGIVRQGSFFARSEYLSKEIRDFRKNLNKR
jgi:hypothetical protein